MKKLKKLMYFSLLIFFVACSPKNEQDVNKNEKSSEVVSVVESTETTKEVKEDLSFKDDASRDVKLPNSIERIAPSGTLAQQVLLGIAPEKMVAVASIPKEEKSKKILSKFTELPEIGQFYGKLEFNAESLAAAKPDLIIDIGEPKKTIVEDMNRVEEKSGKPAIFIEMNFENAADAYRKLGKILNEEEKSSKLADYVDRVNNEIKEAMGKVADKKLKFVYLSGEDGLVSNPKGSFHMQMLGIFGENVYQAEEKSSKDGGNKFSQEELLALDPDVIIFAPGSIYDSVKENPAFANLKAIKEGKYVEAPSTPFNWVGFPPSVNRFLGTQWIGKLFYPDKFEYDLKDRVIEYFDLFYNYKLSEEEYNSITEKAFFK